MHEKRLQEWDFIGKCILKLLKIIDTQSLNSKDDLENSLHLEHLKTIIDNEIVSFVSQRLYQIKNNIERNNKLCKK